MSLGKDPLSSTPVFIGKSRIAQDIREFIAIASRSDAAVLLTGKTGVGKELVAKAIHYQSPRITRPFLVINPSGVPESLMESCLFGHEKGAFTGATELMRGPFEMASGGTLMIDEVGILPLSVQIKLLRAVDAKEITRIGSVMPIACNMRIIAATSEDLFAAIERGSFRNDLYFRLNCLPLQIPPISERKEDIRPLFDYYLHQAAERHKRKMGIVPDIYGYLEEYPWPGNVREIQAVTERIVLTLEGNSVEKDDVIKALNLGDRRKFLLHIKGDTVKEKLHNIEKDLYFQALKENGFDIHLTAEKEKLPLSTFRDIIKRLGLEETMRQYQKNPMQIKHGDRRNDSRTIYCSWIIGR